MADLSLLEKAQARQDLLERDLLKSRAESKTALEAIAKLTSAISELRGQLDKRRADDQRFMAKIASAVLAEMQTLRQVVQQPKAPVVLDIGERDADGRISRATVRPMTLQ